MLRLYLAVQLAVRTPPELAGSATAAGTCIVTLYECLDLFLLLLFHNSISNHGNLTDLDIGSNFDTCRHCPLSNHQYSMTSLIHMYAKMP